jgi:hypothetical protein
MHFHLPKPLHGWREFVGEVGIIVIGVLIALGAEQVLENIHWRHQVDAGRAALQEDFGALVANADERDLESHCLGQRFGQIAAILQRASEAGRLPPVGPLGNPPLRPWWVDSWAGLVSSQTSLHMPREEMMSYSNIANYGEMISQWNQEEQDDWSTLHTIVGPGRSFGDAEEASVRKALAHATYLAKLMKLSSSQLKAQVMATKLLSNAEITRTRRLAEKGFAALERTQHGLCGPIGPAPAAYGSSPLAVTL